MRFVALDPGTANCGYVVLDTPQLLLEDYGVLHTSKADGDIRSRIDELGSEFRKLLHDFQPDHVAIEDFVEQGKFVGKTYKEMAYLTEHLRLVGRQEGYNVMIYENGGWKKKLMKASRLSKEQVKHYIRKNLPASEVLKIEKRATHIWDSVGIALCHYKDITGGK